MTSWLKPEQFEQFVDALHRVYWNNTSPRKPVISCKDFEMLARIQYGCALRISEVLSLEPEDFDQDSMTLVLHHTKSGWRKHKACKGQGCVKCSFKGKTRYDARTTLPPDLNLWGWLKNKTGKLFPIHPNTALNYYKKAVVLAGLHIVIPQEKRIIKNGSTHMLRRSKSMDMKQKGAPDEVRILKLRHKRDPLKHYDLDITDLQEWEAVH